ncbi:unnamed protein product [Chrysodeixis includens]|uniref:EDR1/CTR1/ARMC3-like peptidase-like domain-containing protein n=1 Tax=Chrysodeixis includens TaxID=689277 RepID=A0A9P0E1E3_CHRIL|nr:unnamed protein product [Chrysodeixis includens]
MCRIIPKAAYTVVEPKSFASLRNINKKFKDTPIEAQRLAVQCYINLLNYHVSRRVMINGDFMHELLGILQRNDTSLKIMACTVLTGLMCEEAPRDLFTAKREEVVSKNLQIEHIGLRTALCTVISASVSAEGADVYLELGTIHYMVEAKEARYMVGAWEPALEAIFRHHPSAKLGYTGRLDINDFTQEGFYCLKRLGDHFPTISEIITSEKPPFSNPVYICMFHHQYDSASAVDVKPLNDKSTRESKLALSTPSGARIRFPSVADDINLRAYLYKLRMWFGDPGKSLHYFEIDDAHYEVRYREKCIEVSTSLKQRAQLLAEYVVEQMCGLTQERDCSMPSVDLHLVDLMLDLGSPIIGLGFVKCGGALERALVYKVLADRLGLPCGLYRTSSAHAWCEVAVPELDPSAYAYHAPNTVPPLRQRAQAPAPLVMSTTSAAQ